MDKNKHEKQNLYEWACKYTQPESKSCFTNIDKHRKTYYEKAGSEYLHEYGFESVGELKALIQKQWGGDPVFSEIEQTVLVAAFKNMTKAGSIEKEIPSKDSKEELPTFIYNF